jgi:hypothetical protein
MILTRCLAGALNGNVAVVRAALGDITDDTNSTDGMPLLAAQSQIHVNVNILPFPSVCNVWPRMGRRVHRWQLHRWILVTSC